MSADGLAVIDKPEGWTSHDVVARMRRILGTRKVGHAGTLDPMATGVLVLGVGRGTNLLTYLVGTDKTYLATIRLGASTVTDDREGEVLTRAEAGGLDEQAGQGGVRGPFSYRTSRIPLPQVPCHLTHTNSQTHDIIAKNIDRSPVQRSH